MPIIYDETTKNDRMEAVRDRCAGGDLQVLDDANVVLATFPLTGGGGTVSTSSWVLEFVNLTVAATAGGEVDRARIRDSGGTVRVSGLTAGISGTDIIVNNTTVVQGQNVTVAAGQLNHAPDPS